MWREKRQVSPAEGGTHGRRDTNQTVKNGIIIIIITTITIIIIDSFYSND